MTAAAFDLSSLFSGKIALGVDEDEYHKKTLGVISKSALDKVARSPAHYLAWVNGYAGKYSAALDLGKAFHMALLEPAKFAKLYAIAPDFGDLRFKVNKERRAEWQTANDGKLSLDADDAERIAGMVRSVMEHPTGARLIAEGESEVTLRWTDQATGLPCKSRADRWVKGKRLVVDAKSTDDASPEGFARSVAKYRYHVQDALYRDGFAACGEPIDHFALLAVEKEPPYAVAVYTLDADAVSRGYAASRRDIETLQTCLERNEWIAYSSGVTELSLPKWAQV